MPADAVWCDAELTAAGLGTYPGQTCPGYRRHGSNPARFRPHVLRRLIADTCCSHTTASTVSAEPDEEHTWLVDEFGDRTPVTADPDSWWQVAHPALTWTAQVTADPGPEEVFQPCGPHGEDTRCRVCGAVNENNHQELPSMAGYGADTSTTCTICGSTEATDPIFGWRARPRPWPPGPDQPDTAAGEAAPR